MTENGNKADEKLKKQEVNAMFHVTPLATKHVAKYFEGKEISPIRIFYNSGG